MIDFSGSSGRGLGRTGVAVCFFNRGEQPRSMKVTWAQVGLPLAPRTKPVVDVWQPHPSKETANGGVTAMVPPHEVVMVVVQV